MPQTKFKDKLKTLIALQTREGLQALSKAISIEHEKRNDSIHLQGRWTAFEFTNILGTESFDTLTRTRNTIIHDAICFVDLLPDDALIEEAATAIHILTITDHDTHQKKLADYFQRFGYQVSEQQESSSIFLLKDRHIHMEIRVSQAFEEPQGIDLLIFDGSRFPAYKKQNPSLVTEQKQLLKLYLNPDAYKNSIIPFVLFLGGYLEIISQYSERTYAANSLFSLHARLEELIVYFEAMRGSQTE